MSSTYDHGVKALQELLPPLEDCPNCGTDRGKAKATAVSKAEYRAGLVVFALACGAAVHLLRAMGRPRTRYRRRFR